MGSPITGEMGENLVFMMIVGNKVGKVVKFDRNWLVPHFNPYGFARALKYDLE